MEKIIDGVTYELKRGKGCIGCVANGNSTLCNNLGVHCTHPLSAYWVKVESEVSPTGEMSQTCNKPKRKRGYVC